jgi:hypothetical protein
MNLEHVGYNVWKSVRESVDEVVWWSESFSLYNSVRDPMWDSVYGGLQLPIRQERAGK